MNNNKGGNRRGGMGGLGNLFGNRRMTRMLLMGLIALCFGVYQYIQTGEFTMDRRGQGNFNKNKNTKNIKSNRSDAKVLEDLQDGKLIYTQHAKCRMDCRTISKEEILDILENGVINQRKSKPNDSPCPSYALEGDTDDGQEVRIVFADCGNKTKVITAIDLDRNYDCHCP